MVDKSRPVQAGMSLWYRHKLYGDLADQLKTASAKVGGRPAVLKIQARRIQALQIW